MEFNFTTDRLNLSPITLADDQFILELVNSPGWLRFIGDRNIHNTDDAQGYINKILSNFAFPYWVVSLKTDQTPIGVITFIKRDYLDFPDLGFAFLPDYMGAGYAFEAASTIKNYVLSKNITERILATTLPANVASIKLLAKLGFRFQQDMVINDDTLAVYEYYPNLSL